MNFSLQVTPFAAYITLKKSALKDQNVQAVPTQPMLVLLQQAHRVIADLREENEKLRINSEAFKMNVEKLVNENAALVDDIDVSNSALVTSNDSIKT